MWEALAYIHLHEPWQHHVQDFTFKSLVPLNDREGEWLPVPKDDVGRAFSAISSVQTLVGQKDHKWRCPPFFFVFILLITTKQDCTYLHYRGIGGSVT